jgi:hypothetical protein
MLLESPETYMHTLIIWRVFTRGRIFVDADIESLLHLASETRTPALVVMFATPTTLAPAPMRNHSRNIDLYCYVLDVPGNPFPVEVETQRSTSWRAGFDAQQAG